MHRIRRIACVPTPPSTSEGKPGGELTGEAADPHGVPFLDTGGSAVGLRLVLRDKGGDEGSGQTLQPFVVLDDTDQYSRTYLVVLASRGGEVMGHYSLKMQRSEYALQRRLRSAGKTVTNLEIEAMWHAERGWLLRLQARGHHVPAVFDISPSGSRRVSGALPPHLYCRHRQVLFTPRSPVSGQRLRVCRDDTLLVQHGLPTYSGSAERFLYAPADVKAGKVHFYALRKPKAQSGVKVETAEELFRAQGKTVKGKSRIAAKAPHLHARLRRSFPCYECSESKSCYPKGNAYPLSVERLVPLNFYDAEVLCTELGDLSFDQCVDLMGGRADDPVEGLEEAGAEVGARVGGGLRFFEGDSQGRGPVESLRLKLWTVYEIARALRNHHAVCSEPFLSLSHRSVVVMMPRERSQIPALWGLRVGLTGAASTTRMVLPEAEVELFSPPTVVEPLYASRRLQAAKQAFGELRRGSLEVVACEQKEESGGPGRKYRVEACLTDDSLRTEEVCRSDVFQLFLPEDVQGGELMAHVSEKAANNGRTRLVSQARSVPEGWVGNVSEERPIRLESIDYALYPSYHLACDLFGLGTLLFRALAVNDCQTLATVRSAVESMEDSLSSERTSRAVEIESWIEDWLDRQIGGGSGNSVLSKRQVLYPESERRGGGGESIPDEVWRESLRIGLRLVTTLPGFSFCESAGDPPGEGAVAVLDRVTDGMRSLVQQLDTILFDQGWRNREIREAIEELMKESGSA